VTTTLRRLRLCLRAIGWPAVGAVLALTAARGLGAAELPYRLGPQDRLRIHVYEWPALTGEFTVGADDQISLPVVGEVPVSGLRPSDLAREISARLKVKAGLSDLPDTAVGVAQYRPFYVVGGVDRAGEYAYRPGMIVLNAFSIAGGAYRRTEVSGWGPERDSLSAQGDLRVHDLRRQELLAKELRLKAEIDQLDALPKPPPDLSPTAAGFLAEERATFAAHRERLRNETTALRQVVVLHQEEIETLKGQREAADRQRASVQRELVEVRDLVARGLAPTPRVLPLERTVAQIEREQKELETLMLRARQQINTAGRMIATLKDERVAAAATELLAVQAQIREAGERSANARRVIQESALFSAGTPTGVQGEPPTLAFSIVRTEGGEPREIEAVETTPMRPGDILKVEVRSREVGARQVARQEAGTVVVRR
jgi:exopolysaccharide production protein ExoF